MAGTAPSAIVLLLYSLRSKSMNTTQKTLSAANAGTVTLGDLTVNRLGFGAMRITGEGIGAQADMQTDGKIRHIGVSNFTVEQLHEARGIVNVVSVQNRYNLGDRASEAVLDECEALGLPFLPWAPLGGNHRDATTALQN